MALTKARDNAKLKRTRALPKKKRRVVIAYDDVSAGRKAYDRQFKKLSKTLLLVVMRAFASYDAIGRVNDTLHSERGFNLTDDSAGLEVSLIEAILRQTIKLELAKCLLQNSALGIAEKQAVIDRIIAQIYPMRDNLGAAPNPLNVSSTKKALERMVREESEKSRRIHEPKILIPTKEKTNAPRDKRSG